MSESYITSRTSVSARTEAEPLAMKSSSRFTPLRSAIVSNEFARSKRGEIRLSPLVPAARRKT
ncbi:MAG: hypothetical protein AAF405_00140 [Pseudomonadota bacterium]